MKSLHWRLALSALLAATLVACGGSDHFADQSTRLTVVGDSLSDSGTFYNGPGTARTFTVQGTAGEPYVLWVERLAKAYELEPLCATYHFNGQTFDAGDPGCSNHAVGGARINNALQPGGNDAPLSIPWQLADAGAAGWQRDDLLIVDGGGNDMGDLATAWLGSTEDGGAGYQQLLRTLLPEDVLTELLRQENGAEQAGAVYLQALADRLADAVLADALDQGATRVLVANMPTVTFTPKFQHVLDGIEQKAGATARAQIEGLFRQWIDAFNDRLAARFANEPRVRVVDVAGRFNAFMADPASWGLSNVKIPVCGADGFDQVPQRAFADCTAAALDATPPPPGAPAGRNWWQHFLFADDFHPTPYGHKLMGEQALDVLTDAGWH